MLLAIAVTLLIVAAVGFTRTARAGELIVRHPYNNRHNDASGAREDHLG